MRYGAQLPGLLGECGLREKLLTLQILNAVLHLGNLGFVDFEGCLRGRGGWRCFAWGLRLLPPGQPHDSDHEEGQSDEKPGLNVLWEKALGFRRFFLDVNGLVRLAHGWFLSLGKRDA
jgi:hypothetical protein